MDKVKGFTLIEVVITIVILSIIAAISSRVLAAGFNAYLINQNITNADTQARLAFGRMTRDIHAINSSSSITTATATQLAFTNINNTSITYQLSGSQLTYNSQILADGITSLAFTYFDSSGASTSVLSAIRYITVTLGLNQGGVNYTMRTTINTMNYR